MTNLKRFINKVIIVTGAASGMGRASVIRFVAEGGKVIAVDLNEEGLKETVSLAGGDADNVYYLVGSTSNEEDVKRIFDDVIAVEGKLDVLAHFAGILRFSLITETSLEDFMLPVHVNLVGTFLVCREALPYLVKTKGNIVNTASTSAFQAHPYMTAYAASKGGVLAFTKSLAWEYLKQGVRVNAISPGGISTGMTAVSPFESLGDKADYTLFDHLSRPDHLFGKPEQVAGVVAMLASDDGSFMTGEIVKIDGGVHN